MTKLGKTKEVFTKHTAAFTKRFLQCVNTIHLYHSTQVAEGTVYSKHTVNKA